jgi:hypothetical protein
MQADQQLEFFRTRFGRIQPKLQLETFKLDLARLNHDVMSAALRQAEAIAQSTKRAPSNARLAVLGQYQRITASIGQLFPVFFLFESAWRSYVAMRLSLVYGGETWWHDIRDAVAQGADPSRVTLLGGKPAKPEVVTITSRILSAAPLPGDLSTTYDLIAEAGLGQVGRLIERHWMDMSMPFSSTAALGLPTLEKFESLFAKVRNARNDAYHHRVVSERMGVVQAAEQLLDLLNIHLGDRVKGINDVQLQPLTFTVFKEVRHD